MTIQTELQEVRATVKGGSYVIRNNANLQLMPSYDNFAKEHLDLYLKYRNIYKNQITDWMKNKDLMDIRAQTAALEKLAQKYQLNYFFERRHQSEAK